jgi:hypothetical protein
VSVNAALPVGVLPVGPVSVNMRCPNCNMDILTKANTQFKGSAHMLFLAFCSVG